MTALLAAEDARLDARGGVLVEGLSFEAEGDRVALVGDASALFSYFLGSADLVRGSLRVLGEDARAAVAGGRASVSSPDVPLPESWTPVEYLRASAALSGLDRRSARRAAAETLELAGLATAGKLRIGTLGPFLRRALSFGAAAVGAPTVLAVDRPFTGLSPGESDRGCEVLEQLAAGRKLIVGLEEASAVGPAARLLATATCVVVVFGGRLVSAASPADPFAPRSEYAVRVGERAEEFVRILGERGIAVDPGGGAGARGEARFVVHVPAGSGTREIVEAAVEAGAPLFEMVPAGGAPGRP